MGQRRRRPHPTRADQRRPSNRQTLSRSQIYCDSQWGRRRPHPTSADQATTRHANGARSTAIYNGTASPAPTPDQSRPAPTKQPPDPLTEPDLLRFTMGQRRRRPHPTRADQATARPSNGAGSTAIYNGTAKGGGKRKGSPSNIWDDNGVLVAYRTSSRSRSRSPRRPNLPFRDRHARPLAEFPSTGPPGTWRRLLRNGKILWRRRNLHRLRGLQDSENPEQVFLALWR